MLLQKEAGFHRVWLAEEPGERFTQKQAQEKRPGHRKRTAFRRFPVGSLVARAVWTFSGVAGAFRTGAPRSVF